LHELSHRQMRINANWGQANLAGARGGIGTELSGRGTSGFREDSPQVDQELLLFVSTPSKPMLDLLPSLVSYAIRQRFVLGVSIEVADIYLPP
jgi:hypothetical protein